MRRSSIVVTMFACAASSLALAQQRDAAIDATSPVATTTASVESDDGTARGKSGFGQIMSVLTGLLQDAAGKEVAGASSSASQMLSSDQSAVTITVSPVAGRSTLFVDKPSGEKMVRGRPNPGGAMPPAQVAVTK